MLEFSYCCSPIAIGEGSARVSDILSGSDLRGRTTDRLTEVPGLPSSISRITANDSSRVDWSPMDSMTSPSVRCSLSAGEPGVTLTTVA